MQRRISKDQVQVLLAEVLVGQSLNVSGWLAEIAEVSYTGGEIRDPCSWELNLEIKSYFFATISLAQVAGGSELLMRACGKTAH